MNTLLRAVASICMAGAVVAARADGLPKPFVAGALQHIVAAHGDAPLIVRFRSLDCGYCLQEMPRLKVLSARHSNWRLVLVDTDDMTHAAVVAEVLRRAGFDPGATWMFADGHVQRLRYSVDPKWRGELPRTYLYRSGKRLAAVSGVLDEAAIERQFRFNEEKR